MANTYSQIYIQFVFSVKYRNAVVHSDWKTELFKYITGIVKNNGHLMICINGMPDHIHILIGMNPKQSVSNLLQDIKVSSSKWINEKRFVKGKFECQEGYGAFSYSQSQIKDVIAYIENQEDQHKKKSFKEEYTDFLKKFEVDYDEKFTFKELI
jgi:putative transposase